MANEISPCQAIISLLKDPQNGDLIIAGDINQGIYQNAAFTWSELGIKARGRTYYLRSNYRNTKEILKVAAPFSVFDKLTNDDDRVGIVPVNPEMSIRTGPKPYVYRCKDRAAECDLALKLVKHMLNPKEGTYFSKHPINPHDIGILYPLATKELKGYLKKIEEDVNSFSAALWVNDDTKKEKSHDLKTKSSVKISTISSAKGLDFRAVILLFSDQRDFDDELDDDRTLLYVGLTRARDYLWILYSQMSDLIPPLYEMSENIVAKEYPQR
ncbi:MAG: 3'-5' exonuclease [Methanobacteriota archaeon]